MPLIYSAGPDTALVRSGGDGCCSCCFPTKVSRARVKVGGRMLSLPCLGRVDRVFLGIRSVSASVHGVRCADGSVVAVASARCQVRVRAWRRVDPRDADGDPAFMTDRDLLRVDTTSIRLAATYFSGGAHPPPPAGLGAPSATATAAVSGGGSPAEGAESGAARTGDEAAQIVERVVAAGLRQAVAALGSTQLAIPWDRLSDEAKRRVEKALGEVGMTVLSLEMTDVRMARVNAVESATTLANSKIKHPPIAPSPMKAL